MKIGCATSNFQYCPGMIDRADQLDRLTRLLKKNPVVAILGPRQVGKTTLARAIVAQRDPSRTTVFDLESARDVARLSDAEFTLGRLRGLVVLDEVQRRPDLFQTLRVLADRPRTPARFLVLGSASPELLRQTSESLAGRIAYHELPGFTLDEIGIDKLDKLWLRGSFPRSFLARTHADSTAWREAFIKTFLERDVPQFGIAIPSATLERFWAMLAHSHGQVWNASEFARSFGVSHHATRRYLEALQTTFMVRTLRPFSANIGKRQVKSPKVYLRDSGVLHSFLDVRTMHDLERHPKLGASWEGFMLEAVVHQLRAAPSRCYFWATHTGAELDLMVTDGRRRRGFEFKRNSSPTVTRSIRIAIDELGLSSVDIVHAGEDSYPLARDVRALAARDLLTLELPKRS